MKHASVFNGIGGFQYAAKIMGWENVWHCEIDEWCNKIVKQHYPKSICYEDIKKLNATKWNGLIDVLTGGFPCQPFSSTGDRKGTEDNRYLWPEMLRIISEVQPRYIVGENVLGLLNWSRGLVFEKVQADLETAGYDAQAYVLPAVSVNASHRRDRVWFVAHACGFGLERGNGCNSQGHEQTALGSIQALVEDRNWHQYARSRISGSVHGVSDRVHRIKALGNAIVPQVAVKIFKAIEQFELQCSTEKK